MTVDLLNGQTILRPRIRSKDEIMAVAAKIKLEYVEAAARR